MSDAHPPLFRRLWLRLMATAGVAAAVLLSWWWKVDEARLPDEIPAVSFGQQVDLGRTRFQPEALQLRRTPEKPDQLVLTGTIENVTGETQTAVFGIPGKPPELSAEGLRFDAPEILLLRDNAPLGDLQPRMPERIALVWTLSEPWTPRPVTINLTRQVFKLRDNLYGKSSWLGHVPAGRITTEPRL